MPRVSTATRSELKAILRQFGQVVPLPLDAATDTLIDGHAVFDALVELGHDEIAVVRLENRSEPEVRALRLALNRVAQDAVWDDAKLRGELCEAAAKNGLEQKNLCVWVKSNAGMGSFYRSQHELIFVFKHGEGPHQNNFGLGAGGRTRSNVWQYRGVNAFGKDRMDLLGIHPTVKPVAMIADALRDVTRRGDIVLDAFLGSGSTLIAAEETGRVCIGVELDPVYVDAAIRRWQKRTGKNAVHAVTGEIFDAIAERVVSPVTTTDVAVAELPAGAAATGALVAAGLPIASTNVTKASEAEAGNV